MYQGKVSFYLDIIEVNHKLVFLLVLVTCLKPLLGPVSKHDHFRHCRAMTVVRGWPSNMLSVAKLVVWCTYDMMMWRMSGITFVALPYPLDVSNMILEFILAWAINKGWMHPPTPPAEKKITQLHLQIKLHPPVNVVMQVHMVSGNMAVPTSLMCVSWTPSLVPIGTKTTRKLGKCRIHDTSLYSWGCRTFQTAPLHTHAIHT